jgi:hypothetical protein
MRREAIARAGGKCVHCGDDGSAKNGDQFGAGGDRVGSELGFEYASGCAPENGAGRIRTVELSKIWSCSKERIERELLRCVLLCRTCRTRKRSTERAETRGHGTITSYKYGCRCAECREVYNEYKRGWRARQAKEIETGLSADMIDVTRDGEDDEEPVTKVSSNHDRIRSAKTPLRACG